MTTPTTLMTDNGKDFLSRSFADLLDELKEQDAQSFTFFRADGGAAAMLTTNPRLIQAIRNYTELGTDLSEEASHAGD